MNINDIDVEPARSLSTIENVSPDNSLATAQFEAIIRAWKGEAVEGVVPTSPVGEADWDGSLAFGQLGMNAPLALDTYHTWCCQPAPTDGNCSLGCGGCTVFDGTCAPIYTCDPALC